MLATSRQEKHANINLDRAIFFSPNTLKHSQSTTPRHLPFSQLPPSSPVPVSQSPRPAQYLSRSARPLLPPKPPTLPPKPNRTSYPQSLANTAHLPPIPLHQSLKAASPTPPFRQGEFERITHESLPTPDFSSLTHATKAETLADRVPTLLPTAESPINHHGAGYLNVGFSPQHVRLRTGDSPDSTRHGSDARQRQTTFFNYTKSAQYFAQYFASEDRHDDSDYDERIQCRKRCQSVAAIDAYASDREAVRGELKHAMRSSCPPRCPEEGDGNIFGDLRQSNETQQPCAYFEEFPIHQAMLKCVRIGDETTFCVTGFCEEISHPCLAPDATDSVRIELSSATFEMRSRGTRKRQKLSPRKQQPSSLSTNRSRKSWTSAEDRTIMILKQAGKGWPEIAAALPERTEAAVRARYFGKLAKVAGPTIEDQDEFEVEALLARRKGSRTEYLVQWKGYPDEENSWVAQDDISTELVIEYERNHAIHGGLFSGISLLKQDRRGGDDNKYLVQFRGRPSEENMWVWKAEKG
ncbi:hypothetical protein FGLOB1_14480 [Fusarium globosum]|uniref:Chromo domain-containing protein n=1 Tax=Fusarium globosum TaxID=78864 RepID=A0A8H6CUL4_9HYPO|nr:hypothetical protein FGLOB1_14480 [Fusarium globosum]